jgi:hypothetical protein
MKILIFHFITLKKWEKTIGKILKFEIATDNNEVDYYGWGRKIEYEYQVNGRLYTNNIITRNIVFNYQFKEYAENIYGNNFKENSDVHVFYNPQKPLESVLINKFSLLNSLLIVGAMAIIVIGLNIS